MSYNESMTAESVMVYTTSPSKAVNYEAEDDILLPVKAVKKLSLYFASFMGDLSYGGYVGKASGLALD